MLPSARVRNPEGNLIFQWDNHPVHCSMGLQRWFARRPEIERKHWPPKSPDLNVVEHMWAKLKEGSFLRYVNNPPRNPQQLWDQVVEIWDDLAQDHDQCLTLVDSISRRCQSVIDAGGMWTRYQMHMLLFFVCFKSLVFLCFVRKSMRMPMLLYGEYVFIKLNQGIEFFVALV